MRIPVVLHEGAELPSYAHHDDAGADLRCTSEVRLRPGERVVVGTGVRVALPPGHVGLVAPRSGLAARLGLSIVNAPGIVDAGYRGEIRVCLVNLDPERPIELAAGDRIAQLVIVPYVTAQFHVVDSLDDTKRGEGGYGSTDIRHPEEGPRSELRHPR